MLHLMGFLKREKGKGKRDLETILILFGVGLALFMPVGSDLGFLGYRKRNEQGARIEALNLEVASLSLEIMELRLHVKHTQSPGALQ